MRNFACPRSAIVSRASIGSRTIRNRESTWKSVSWFYKFFIWFVNSQRLIETTGSKPKMKSQFRAHRMAVLLQLLPELQRTGQHDVQQGHGILTPEGLETAGTGSGLSLPAWVNGSYIDVTKERSTPSGTKEVTCVVPQPHTPTASPSTSNATTTVNNGSSPQGSQAGNSGSVTAISDSTVYSTALSVTIGIIKLPIINFVHVN